MRRGWLAGKSKRRRDFAALCLLSHGTREEWNTFAARHGQKLFLRNTGAAHEVDGFTVRDDDGTRPDGDAVCAGKVVEMGMGNEDIIRLGHIVDGQILWQCRGSVKPGV
jgi:hypothetical protein